jgi:hypothetical protein
MSDVVAGLQWIYDNRGLYNIRVANLSVNSTVAESYHTSPLASWTCMPPCKKRPARAPTPA